MRDCRKGVRNGGSQGDQHRRCKMVLEYCTQPIEGRKMAVLASRRVGTLLRVDSYTPGKGKTDAPSRRSQRRRRGRPGPARVEARIAELGARGASRRRGGCAIGAGQMDADGRAFAVRGRWSDDMRTTTVRQWRSPWEGSARITELGARGRLETARGLRDRGRPDGRGWTRGGHALGCLLGPTCVPMNAMIDHVWHRLTSPEVTLVGASVSSCAPGHAIL